MSYNQVSSSKNGTYFAQWKRRETRKLCANNSSELSHDYRKTWKHCFTCTQLLLLLIMFTYCTRGQACSFHEQVCINLYSKESSKYRNTIPPPSSEIIVEKSTTGREYHPLPQNNNISCSNLAETVVVNETQSFENTSGVVPVMSSHCAALVPPV